MAGTGTAGARAGRRGGRDGRRGAAAVVEGERGEREREMRERERERERQPGAGEGIRAALPSARSVALGKVNFLRRVS